MSKLVKLVAILSIAFSGIVFSADEEKREIVQNAIKYFKTKYSCDLTDGVRISFDNGWGLIRASNTQPVIVCRFEANNKKNLSLYKQKVINKIQEFGNVNVDKI